MSALHILKTVASLLTFPFQTLFQRCSDCEEVRRLKKLVNDLQELIKLYRKYNCRLALCDFEKVILQTLQ